MERLSQPPDTECCSEQGKADAAHDGASRTNFEKRRQGTSQAVSGRSTPLKPSSLETLLAGGDAVSSAEPPTEADATGKTVPDLPGSKSMARAERVDGNLGGPEESRRANHGSQTGRKVQRQEEPSQAHPGVCFKPHWPARLIWKSPKQSYRSSWRHGVHPIARAPLPRFVVN